MKVVYLLVVSLFNVWASSNFRVEESRGFQGFRSIGEFQQHVTHAHFGVSLSFGRFEERLRALENTLFGVKESEETPYVKASFARLTAMVRKTRAKFNGYASFFLGKSLRDESTTMVRENRLRKRQVMGVAGIAMSAAALYQVNALQTVVQDMQTEQNFLVRHVKSITDDLSITVRNVRKLMGAIHLLKESRMAQDALISLELAVLDMTQDSSRFFAGLDALMDSKLSLELVDDVSLASEFTELRDLLVKQGFDLVFEGHSQVYQLPATFVRGNNSINILVKVPVIPATDISEFHLFQHLAVPVMHRGHLVQVRAREEILAINADRSRFVALTGAEIDACERVGYLFLCPYVSLTS